MHRNHPRAMCLLVVVMLHGTINTTNTTQQTPK